MSINPCSPSRSFDLGGNSPPVGGKPALVTAPRIASGVGTQQPAKLVNNALDLSQAGSLDLSTISPDQKQALKDLTGTVLSLVTSIISSLSGGGGGVGTQQPMTQSASSDPMSFFKQGPSNNFDDSLGLANLIGGNISNAGRTPSTGGGQGISSNNATLDKSLEAIRNDPDGAKLLAAAEAKGVKIEVGDPATARGANDKAVECTSCKSGIADGHGNTSVAKDGATVVNGVTLSDNNTGAVRIVVRDPSNIKTLAHELVHAVTTGDGNSRQEEGIADVIGSRIANRNGGAAAGGLNGSEQQIYDNKQQFYPDLKTTNNIRQSLAGLGLSVSV